MPWTPKDAYRHTHKAKSPKAQRQWSHVADKMLEKTGDEASAIRAANSVVARRKHMQEGGLSSPLTQIAGEAKLGRPILPGMGRMRMPRIPIADTMRNIDQRIGTAKFKMPKFGRMAKGGQRVRSVMRQSGKRPQAASGARVTRLSDRLMDLKAKYEK